MGQQLVFILTISTGLGAVVLRAAVALYNKMAGGSSSPNGVPELEFGKAMGIALVTHVVTIVTAFVVALVTSGEGKNSIIQLISYPISLLVTAVMVSVTLPTRLGRAALVTLCYMLIGVLI